MSLFQSLPVVPHMEPQKHCLPGQSVVFPLCRSCLIASPSAPIEEALPLHQESAQSDPSPAPPPRPENPSRSGRRNRVRRIASGSRSGSRGPFIPRSLCNQTGASQRSPFLCGCGKHPSLCCCCFLRLLLEGVCSGLVHTGCV